MGKAIRPPNNNYGQRLGSKNLRQPKAFGSIPPDPSSSFAAVTLQNKFGQKYIPEELRKHGYPTYNTTVGKSPFYEKQAVRYPAQPYKDIGLFNGFPFLLPEKIEYLSLPVDEKFEDSSFNFVKSGICTRYVTGIDVDTSLNPTTKVLGNGYDLTTSKDTYTAYNHKGDFSRPIAANQYWNLAAIETDWAIETNTMPVGYDTGYCYNPDGASTEGLQLVTQDFEIVESYNLSSFPPHLRCYPDPTGATQVQSIDPETNLIQGSGSQYSSVFFEGQNTGSYAEAYFPLTIQPYNTGAFVITLDEGVANYFDSHSDFGNKEAFNCNMMFDFNIAAKDDEGFERNTIEYHSFPTKAYIIPAAGWSFNVVCSKVKGIYYQYELNPKKRFPGDQTSYIGHAPLSNSDDLSFIHRIEAPQAFGGSTIGYNNKGYTHMPFEDAPTTASTTHGYKYQLEPLLTYLNPVISTVADGIYRQNWGQYSSPDFFSAAGTPDQSTKRFFVAANRDEIVIDSTVLQDHLSSEDKSLNSKISSHQQTHGNDIRTTLAPGVASSSSYVNNPRKNTDTMGRQIPTSSIGSDRLINVKIGDLTQISANKNIAVGCGSTFNKPLNSNLPNYGNGMMAMPKRSNSGTSRTQFNQQVRIIK